MWSKNFRKLWNILKPFDNCKKSPCHKLREAFICFLTRNMTFPLHNFTLKVTSAPKVLYTHLNSCVLTLKVEDGAKLTVVSSRGAKSYDSATNCIVKYFCSGKIYVKLCGGFVSKYVLLIFCAFRPFKS